MPALFPPPCPALFLEHSPTRSPARRWGMGAQPGPLQTHARHPLSSGAVTLLPASHPAFTHSCGAVKTWQGLCANADPNTTPTAHRHGEQSPSVTRGQRLCQPSTWTVDVSPHSSPGTMIIPLRTLRLREFEWKIVTGRGALPPSSHS